MPHNREVSDVLLMSKLGLWLWEGTERLVPFSSHWGGGCLDVSWLVLLLSPGGGGASPFS